MCIFVKIQYNRIHSDIVNYQASLNGSHAFIYNFKIKVFIKDSITQMVLN